MADRPYDRLDGVIWYDGKLAPWGEATLHVCSHGLHYASAVFEGERAYGGEIFKCTEHSERLKRSAQLLDFEIPYSVAEIDAAKRLVLEKNGQKEAYVRPIAWRGSEVLGVSGIGTSVHLAIAPWAQEGRLSVQARDSGINVTMAKYRRPSADFAPGHAKVAGLYIVCGIEKDRALKAGFDDALMLDWKGDLAESTGANIFLVIDDKVVTPTPVNFLDGITRRAVMGLARKRGWTVEERTVRPGELAKASEVFLSGTAAEIVPVGSIDGHHYQAGPVAHTLMADFQKLVREPDSEGFGIDPSRPGSGFPGGLTAGALSTLLR